MTSARRLVAASLIAALLLFTCAASVSGSRTEPARPGPGPAFTDPITEAAVPTTIAVPVPGGNGSLARATPAGATPSNTPAQAGGALAGQALPTNQWWTSALTGPRTQPMWARPIAVQAAEAGLQLSATAPTATANAVVTPFVPALTAGNGVTRVRVTGYGAFHVVFETDLRSGGTVETTLVQGSPVVYLQFRGTEPALATAGTADVTGSTARLNVAGQRWDLLAADGGRWRRDGDRLTASGARDGRIAVARVPDGADTAAWKAAIAGAATDPVVRTTAQMSYDGRLGTVTQTLSAQRASGRPGVWALLPHHRAGLIEGGGLHVLAGSYPDARGSLAVVQADAVRVRVPMPGLLTAAPSVPLSDTARAAVVADLDLDLADSPRAGGSYFGLKELARLATVAEVASGIGASAQRQAALDRLRPELVDWLTYSGPRDGRYFAYDSTWGGLIAVPAEFGSSDYNDHHFQYGYLVRAAAVLAAADPSFLRDYGSMVDLVVRDYSGALAQDGRVTGCPTAAPAPAVGFAAFRVFNAYLGHSAASGFAPFADGNNQESSSEAVAAWEAVVRWGIVRQRNDLIAYGSTHYAMEAATARAYWLGEGIERPNGYAHTSAGIVWDAKIDYATFFDPRPESVQGIQLLPLTFGSLYRADPAAARARGIELARAVGGEPRIWGDLFTADLAVADPAAARRRLTPALPREESTSRALLRYWIELLASYGPPQPAVVADGPFGLAFGSRDKPTLVAVNPTGADRTVTFAVDGRTVATVSVGPGQRTVLQL